MAMLTTDCLRAFRDALAHQWMATLHGHALYWPCGPLRGRASLLQVQRRPV